MAGEVRKVMKGFLITGCLSFIGTYAFAQCSKSDTGIWWAMGITCASITAQRIILYLDKK